MPLPVFKGSVLIRLFSPKSGFEETVPSESSSFQVARCENNINRIEISKQITPQFLILDHNWSLHLHAFLLLFLCPAMRAGPLLADTQQFLNVDAKMTNKSSWQLNQGPVPAQFFFLVINDVSKRGHQPQQQKTQLSIHDGINTIKHRNLDTLLDYRPIYYYVQSYYVANQSLAIRRDIIPSIVRSLPSGHWQGSNCDGQGSQRSKP
jgi:hypothetical protein